MNRKDRFLTVEERSQVGDDFHQVVADKFIFKVKKGLLYGENDTWARVEGGSIRLGITDYLQRRGGDIVYIQLPKIGDKVKQSEDIAQLETIKAVMTVASPLAGTVSEINSLLNDKPELVNEDPYGEGWLILISLTNLGDIDRLLKAEEYFELMKKKIQDELKRRMRGGKGT